MIVLLLLSCFIIYHATAVNANKNVLHVPTDYPTIQDAVNHANPGDIIYVHNGTYYENILINKSVILIGENVDSTILDGNGKGSVITITADNVTVTGFTIKNSGTNIGDSGILVSTLSTRHVITGNKIINNNNGIGLYISRKNTISSNLILNNHEGIALYTSSENILINNTISENTVGIGIYFSYTNTISSNTISNNGNGIMIFNSANNKIYHNNFIENDVDAQVDNSFTIWSYKREGNYWSRYSEQDLNQDGIGDSPYNITEEARDPYPLMGMFFSFKAFSNGEEYYVNVISNSSISDCTVRVGETGSIILCLEVVVEKFASGFIRLALPVKLMGNPLITLVDDIEVEPKILDVSDTEYIYLYITYGDGKHTVKIISSTVLGLYNELLNENEKLKSNVSALNMAYQDLLELYDELLKENEKLKYNFSTLNMTYQGLLEKHASLSANYSELQQNYTELNNEYQKHLLDYYRNMQNVQNLVYILMTSTAAFLATTVYLSRQAQVSAKNKTRRFE